MKRTIKLSEVLEMNISTWSKKDNSVRGCETVPASKLKVGDKVVVNNYFTEIIE